MKEFSTRKSLPPLRLVSSAAEETVEFPAILRVFVMLFRKLLLSKRWVHHGLLGWQHSLQSSSPACSMQIHQATHPYCSQWYWKGLHWGTQYCIFSWGGCWPVLFRLNLLKIDNETMPKKQSSWTNSIDSWEICSMWILHFSWAAIFRMFQWNY